MDIINDLPRESYKTLVETINRQNKDFEPAIPVDTVVNGRNGFVTAKSKIK